MILNLYKVVKYDLELFKKKKFFIFNVFNWILRFFFKKSLLVPMTSRNRLDLFLEDLKDDCCFQLLMLVLLMKIQKLMNFNEFFQFSILFRRLPRINYFFFGRFRSISITTAAAACEKIYKVQNTTSVANSIFRANKMLSLQK